MIKRYIYGNPIPTNAVAATDIENGEGELQYFSEIETDLAKQTGDLIKGADFTARIVPMTRTRQRKSSLFTVLIISL